MTQMCKFRIFWNFFFLEGHFGMDRNNRATEVAAEIDIIGSYGTIAVENYRYGGISEIHCL